MFDLIRRMKSDGEILLTSVMRHFFADTFLCLLSRVDCFGLGKLGVWIRSFISVYCLMISNMARPRNGTEQVLYIAGIASNLLEGPFIIFGSSFLVIRKGMRGRFL